MKKRYIESEMSLTSWRTKGWEGGKNKDNLGRMKRAPDWEKQRIWSCKLEKRIEFILKRKHTGKKELPWQISIDQKDQHSHWNMRTPFLHRNMKTHLERYGINTWLRSNSNTTTKTKQRVGLAELSRKQIYDRDFVWYFRGESSHGLDRTVGHHVQGSVHDATKHAPES